MAAFRQPGHLCATRQSSDVEDGTMCRAASPLPGYSCSVEKPVRTSSKEEQAVLRRQIGDMQWQKEEALAIWDELIHKKLPPDKFAEDRAKDEVLDLGKAVVFKKEREEFKEFTQELLKLAKEGAKASHVQGKLASRIRRFLKISELKGKANRLAQRKLRRDLKGFRSEHLSPTKHLKKIGKGLVIDLFLKWSRDFILASGAEQLAKAQSPDEINAAKFLIGDAMVLDAWDKIGDVRFWNSHSFWRRVYSDLSQSHQDGKLNSASAVWAAWSNAVTKEDPEDKPPEEQTPATVHLMDAKIRESTLSIGVRP